jgi:hypothetical protein
MRLSMWENLILLLRAFWWNITKLTSYMEKLFGKNYLSQTTIQNHTITFPDFDFKTHLISTYIYSQPISLLVLTTFM